ncbi:hypothetical protein M0657_006060 [Pyricularia oryzae]|uniref:Uncharacterized protein n=1 Tax=Pyricularia oryzae TaxID=318829 RepID=A0A4P7NUB1_PYROR|nr:hypothetical protein MCOR17_003582 [Pyricularia oryzae]KAI6637573.1 hypothetical protein MCOR14_004747 [Pyricularia oryzae]KAI7921346.1 hypothetical protein M9X92_005436 [Pyricularia oryzae]KAI7921507.1 hypothetical protein M0657_006060 [Pyricularia oryzae]QBZ65982.1 hypothetical protein PoMZ_12949 [Pyricularia oryzae]
MKERIPWLQLVHLGEHGLFSLLGDARGFQSCRNRGKGGLPFAGLQGRLKWVRREMGCKWSDKERAMADPFVLVVVSVQ